MADGGANQAWCENMGKAMGTDVPKGGAAEGPSLSDVDKLVTLQAAMATAHTMAKRHADLAITAATSLGRYKATADEAVTKITAFRKVVDIEIDTAPSESKFRAVAPVEPLEAAQKTADQVIADCDAAHKEAVALRERIQIHETNTATAKESFDDALQRAGTLATSLAEQSGLGRGHAATAGKIAARARTLLAEVEAKKKKGGAAAKSIDIEAERAAAAKIAADSAAVDQRVADLDTAETTAKADLTAMKDAADPLAKDVKAIEAGGAEADTAKTKAKEARTAAWLQEAEIRRALNAKTKDQDQITAKIGPVPIEVRSEKDIGKGPVKIKEMKAVGVLEAEKVLQKGGSGLQGGVAATEDGLEIEFKKEVAEKLDATTTVKKSVGGKANYKEAAWEFGLEVMGEGGWGGSLNFKPFGIEWDEANVSALDVQLSVTRQLEFPSEMFPGWTIKIKIAIEITVGPDWRHVAGEMAKRFGPQAAGGVALSVGMIAAGAATIAFAFYSIATRKEFANRADEASKIFDTACAAFAAVLEDQAPPGGKGAEIGIAQANAALAKATVPKPDFVKEARRSGIKSKAKDACRPAVMETAIAAYWKDHPVERAVYGDEGAGGGGGFRIFKLTLEAALR